MNACFPVSLVIPVRNEENSLAALFASVFAQTLPPDEILLVDGGSTDSTRELIRAASAADSRVQLAEAGPATPGRGRNIGIALASHDWVALTDAGIELEPEWLQRLVDALGDTSRPKVVYGRVEPTARTFFQECLALCSMAPRRETPEGRMSSRSIASALIHRDCWQAVGGFPDLRAAEDLTFMEAVEAAGFDQVFAPRAVVHWEVQPGPRAAFHRFRVYSLHNAAAGRQWDWHYGVGRMYLAGGLFAILSALVSPWLLAAPLAGSALRAVKTLWIRREGRGPGWALNPRRLAGVAAVLLLLDSAMFAGWIQATLRRPRDPVSALPESRK